GASAGLARAIELVRPRGTIVLKSTAAAGANLNLAPIVIDEIAVVGSRGGRHPAKLQDLIEILVSAGRRLGQGRGARGRRIAGAIAVGVDTGGTFTDLVAMADGGIVVYKLLSTPEDPARAVIEGLGALLDGAAAGALTYSSTVATNALLEKKGARVALFTNAGFED